MNSQFSYLYQLRCSVCQKPYDPNQVQTWCPECNTPLIAEYRLDLLGSRVSKEEIVNRPNGMWRWHELLPVVDPEKIITQGEGDTPVLSMPRLGSYLGFSHLYIKDESLNPTGSFKARGLAAAISKAYELGITRVIIPTAGNAGGAMAAYAARAGMQAAVFMPTDTPEANQLECKITGANVVLVDGLINDAAVRVREKVRLEGWFDVSTFKEPYRLEGKKVMGLELAITIPLGCAGCNCVSYWWGNRFGWNLQSHHCELQALGWMNTNRLPRIVAVQAEVVPRLSGRLRRGRIPVRFLSARWHPDCRVPKSFADRMILQPSGRRMGPQFLCRMRKFNLPSAFGRYRGMFVFSGRGSNPGGYVEIAGLRLAQPDERVVLLNTATGEISRFTLVNFPGRCSQTVDFPK